MTLLQNTTIPIALGMPRLYPRYNSEQDTRKLTISFDEIANTKYKAMKNIKLGDNNYRKLQLTIYY